MKAEILDIDDLDELMLYMQRRGFHGTVKTFHGKDAWAEFGKGEASAQRSAATPLMAALLAARAALEKPSTA